MTVYLHRSQEGISYATLQAPSFDITYEANWAGLFSRVRFEIKENCENHVFGKELTHTFSASSPAYDLNAEETQEQQVDDERVKEEKGRVRQVAILMTKTANNIAKIALKLGIPFDSASPSIDSCQNFIGALRGSPFVSQDHIDLSHAGLDGVPPHVALFRNAKSIDLSHNQLRVLAVELINPPHLMRINLKGNPIWDLPDWLEEWRTAQPNRVVEWNDVKCKPEHLAQSSLCEDHTKDWRKKRRRLMDVTNLV